MRTLLDYMSVPVGTIQSTLNAFLTPYINKSCHFFGSPTVTHLTLKRCIKQVKVRENL